MIAHMEDPWQSWLQSQSEEAFRAVVRWHLPLVLATARRWTNGNAALAQDISQLVFIDLARNARALPKGVVLAGWLYRHTCFTAAKALRSERRRAAREKIAAEQFGEGGETNADARLDEIMARLPAKDRHALLLRFAEGRDLQGVAGMLGISRAAAQKRIERALVRVRESLPQVLRSRVSTAAGVAALLVPSQAKTAAAEVETAVQQMALLAGKSGRLSPLIVFFRNMGVMQGAALGIAVSVLVWAVPISVQVQEWRERNAKQPSQRGKARDVTAQALEKKRYTSGEVGEMMAGIFLNGGFSYDAAGQAQELLKLVSASERLEAVQEMLKRLPPGSNVSSESVGSLLKNLAKDAGWVPKKYPDDILTALELMPRKAEPEFDAILEEHPDVNGTVRLYEEIKRRNESRNERDRLPTFARAVARALAGRDAGEALTFCRTCGEAKPALEGLAKGIATPEQRKKFWEVMAGERDGDFRVQALARVTPTFPEEEAKETVSRLPAGVFRNEAATEVVRGLLGKNRRGGSDTSKVDPWIDWWVSQVPSAAQSGYLTRLWEEWESTNIDTAAALYNRLAAQFDGHDLDRVLSRQATAWFGGAVNESAVAKIADDDIRYFAACELYDRMRTSAQSDETGKAAEATATWMREHFTPAQQEAFETLYGKK